MAGLLNRAVEELASAKLILLKSENPCHYAAKNFLSAVAKNVSTAVEIFLSRQVCSATAPPFVVRVWVGGWGWGGGGGWWGWE